MTASAPPEVGPPHPGPWSRAGLAAALGLALGLSLYGQSWGLPATFSWSNDDVAPEAPIEALEVWRDDWYKYPALQPLIDRALYEPWLAAWRRSGAIVDSEECRIPTRDRCFDDPNARIGWLLRLSRLRSAAMAVGTVLAVWAITRRVGGGGVAAAWAALFTASLQTLIFFAHTGNVDVPQVFWFAWSIVAWLAAMGPGEPTDESTSFRGGRIAAYAVFGALAGAALATKEAIVGAYVLPGLALLFRTWRPAPGAGEGEGEGEGDAANSPGGPERPRLRTRALTDAVRRLVDPRLLSLGAALAAVYGLTNNILFNFEGFRQHVAYWLTGTGIEPWNDGFHGYGALALRTWERLVDAAGWPLVAWGGVAGAWAALRGRGARLAWLPLVSYALFTIGLVRYVYTRFTLPMAILLCVFGGLLAEAAWRRQDARRPIGLALAGLVLAHSLLYTLHMNRLLVLDARYGAEAWLQEHVPPAADPTIVAVGSETYLPRLDRLGYDVRYLDEDEFTTPALVEARPEVIVISSKAFSGFDGQPRARLEAIIAGAGDYDVVVDLKSESGLERLLIAPYVESRINPRIVVYRRSQSS